MNYIVDGTAVCNTIIITIEIFSTAVDRSSIMATVNRVSMVVYSILQGKIL